MTNDRSPVLDRWELQAVVAALAVGQAVLSTWSPAADPSDALSEPIRQWQARRRQDSGRGPSHARIARERAWLRAGVSLWVAWRLYRIERPGRR